MGSTGVQHSEQTGREIKNKVRQRLNYSLLGTLKLFMDSQGDNSGQKC